ncbi:hypothetical protein JCM3774_000571 [Rhodotorula dairenensis]
MSTASLARFAELPDELLRHVILLSADSDRDAGADSLRRRRRRRQLESLSLVCSHWRALAQRALLDVTPARPIQIYHAKELAPLVDLLQSPAQAIGPLVSHLDIQLWGETLDSDLVTTLRACVRLEQLCLTHVERVRLDEIATGSELASLSLRQCTLVSSYYPDSPPALPSARIPPRLSEPGAFSSLSRLDLRLCSLRRDFLPLELLVGSPRALLPSLRHLLLFTGSHDQSPRTVRALVRSVAGQLRSLSLDYTAYEILFPLCEETGLEEQGGGARLEFPSLRCYGTYWDAAYHTLVGLPLALPALSPSRTSRGPVSPAESTRHQSEHRAVPYLHTSIYPAQLDSLAAALETVITNPELQAANAWTGVEQWRVEGTLRDLDLAEVPEDEDGDDDFVDAPSEGETDESDDESGRDDEDGFGSTTASGRLNEAGHRGQRAPTFLPRQRDSRTASLVRLAHAHARLNLQVESSGTTDSDPDSGGNAEQADHHRGPVEPLRATFERGFGTSWWRFVDEVERELL